VEYALTNLSSTNAEGLSPDVFETAIANCPRVEDVTLTNAGVPGGEFTNRCLNSISNWSSNELRNDFPTARPRSKQQNRCLETWYSPIVS
jgi:hypothetical protein